MNRTNLETTYKCKDCDMPNITVRGHEVDSVICPKCENDMEWESDSWVELVDGEWVECEVTL